MLQKLIAISLITLCSLQQTYAEDLNWFESIFSDIDRSFSCQSINREIIHYPKYKIAIDKYFRKISSQNIVMQRKFYSKFNTLSTRRLTTINQNSQKKMYAIMGYIKCETGIRLDNIWTLSKKWKYSSIKNGVEIRRRYDWKSSNTYFYLKNNLILTDRDFSWDKMNFTILNQLDHKNSYLFISKRWWSWEKKWKYNWYTKKIISLSLIKKEDFMWLALWKENNFNKSKRYYLFNGSWKIVDTFQYDKDPYVHFSLFNYGRKDTLLIKWGENQWKLNYWLVLSWNTYITRFFVDTIEKMEKKRWFAYIYWIRNGYKVWYKYKDWTMLELVNVTEFPKWTFIKYIWWEVEARQNELYTYFYYEWKLINTVMNVKKNDSDLLLCKNKENWYLTARCAMKKLDLYSAWSKHPYIFFKKKNDYGYVTFTYNIETKKWNK